MISTGLPDVAGDRVREVLALDLSALVPIPRHCGEPHLDLVASRGAAHLTAELGVVVGVLEAVSLTAVPLVRRCDASAAPVDAVVHADPGEVPLRRDGDRLRDRRRTRRTSRRRSSECRCRRPTRGRPGRPPTRRRPTRTGCSSRTLPGSGPRRPGSGSRSRSPRPPTRRPGSASDADSHVAISGVNPSVAVRLLHVRVRVAIRRVQLGRDVGVVTGHAPDLASSPAIASYSTSSGDGVATCQPMPYSSSSAAEW